MSPGAVSARFDDRNLIKYGGLVSVVRLPERCGLPELGGGLLRWKSSVNSAGAYPVVKMLTLVFGMVAGADSIQDMDRLRHGAMGKAFTGIRAPSTLGSFLRAFTHGHVQQLAAVCRKVLPALACHAPLLPDADGVAYVDVDDTIRRTYGYAKQGAGIGYTAFVSKPKHRRVAATLIVRRVKRLGTGHPQGQGELFTTYRFHAVFTDSPLTLAEAEKAHRQHAIVEQVIADLKGSALAHVPSGVWGANAAWLQLAWLAYNLSRAAGALAALFHAKATTATIRADLIEVPARLASSGRQHIWHLPQHWHAEHGWHELFTAVHAPPKNPVSMDPGSASSAVTSASWPASTSNPANAVCAPSSTTSPRSNRPRPLTWIRSHSRATPAPPPTL
jgi:hypothetical protein